MCLTTLFVLICCSTPCLASPDEVQVCGISPHMRYSDVQRRLGDLHVVLTSVCPLCYSSGHMAVVVCFAQEDAALRDSLVQSVSGCKAQVFGKSLYSGMTRARVIRALGNPSSQAHGSQKNGNDFITYLYRDSGVRLELTVVFENDRMTYCTISR